MKLILIILLISITLSGFTQSSDQEFIATINGSYQIYMPHYEIRKIDKIEIIDNKGENKNCEVLSFDVMLECAGFIEVFHNKTNVFSDSLKIFLSQTTRTTRVNFYNIKMLLETDTLILNQILINVEKPNVNKITNKIVGIKSPHSRIIKYEDFIKSDSLTIYNNDNNSFKINSFEIGIINGFTDTMPARENKFTPIMFGYVRQCRMLPLYFNNIIGTNEKGEEILFPPFLIFVE